eukprot:m51a1_g9801 putative pas domain-containing protein (1689) ;mRNA; f:1793559-1799770
MSASEDGFRGTLSEPSDASGGARALWASVQRASYGANGAVASLASSPLCGDTTASGDRGWSSTVGSRRGLTVTGKIAAAVLAVELLQIALVPLEAAVAYSAPGGDSATSAADVMRGIWAWGAGQGTAWALAAAAALLWVAPFAWEVRTSVRGEAMAGRLVTKILHVTSDLLRVAVLPAAATAATLHARGGTLNHVAAGLAEASVVLPGLYTSLFHVELLPSRGAFAQADGLASLGLCAAKVAVGALQALRHFGLAVPYAALVPVALFATFGHHLAYVPFYRRRLNLLHCGVLGGAAVSSLASVAAAALRGRSWVPFVACVVAAVPGGLCCALLCSLRLRSLARMLRLCRPSARPWEAAAALRTCYGRRPGADEPLLSAPESAAAFLEAAHAQFADNAAVHLAHGLLLMELCRDPRGMVTHGRQAKRADRRPWEDFCVNSALTAALEALHATAHEGSGVDAALEVADRNTRHAKACASRFWQRLLQARGASATSGEVSAMMQLVDAFAAHSRAAYNVLTGLAIKYPHSFKVLRRFARFMEEIRNDREAAAYALTLADQLEEAAAHRMSKQNRAKIVRLSDKSGAVSFGGQSSRQLQQVQQEEERADSAGGSECASEALGGQAASRSSAAASSIKSSASAANDETAHVRAIRRRIEGARYRTVRRLHMAVVAILLLLGCCLAVEYALSASTIDTFRQNVFLINTTIGMREALFSAIYELRLLETEMRAGNSTAFTVEQHVDYVLSQTRDFELRFDSAFRESDVAAATSAFWAYTRLPLRYFVNGPNASSFANGSYVTSPTPLWDSGYALLNHVNDLVSAVRADPLSPAWTSGDGLRADSRFRFAIDNGPTVLADGLVGASAQFPVEVRDAAQRIETFVSVIYPVVLAVVCAAVGGILVLAMRRVERERQAAAALFRGIPKSSLLNVYDRLVSGDDTALVRDAIVRRSAMSTPAKFRAVLVLGGIALVVLATAMFAVVYGFAEGHKHDGVLLRGIGTRRNLLTVVLWASQELTVDDTTTGSWEPKRAALRDGVLAPLLLIDRQLKNGDRANGFLPYASSTALLREIWYTRPCPSSVPMTECYGVGVMLRRLIDSGVQFAAMSRERAKSAAAGGALLGDIVALEATTTEWLLEGIQALFEQAGATIDAAQGRVSALFWAAVAVCALQYAALRWVMGRLESEVESFVRMLLFLPASVLDTVGDIREFLDGDAELRRDDARVTGREAEEQTRRILEGCDDAVLVCDARGYLLVVNRAAEALTGHSAADLLGCSLSLVLPADCRVARAILTPSKSEQQPGQQQQQQQKIASEEVVLRRAAGGELSVLVSVAQSRVLGATSYALFLRDISQLKQRERELGDQQRSAEQLLYNILPRSLVRDIAWAPLPGATDGAEAPEIRVAARAYESVTILFADIVEFTQATAQLDGEAVVLVLNALVSQWDRLALEFGVEKIKTIGSCFMAAAGVPVPSADNAELMAEFAIAMLWETKAHNKTARVPMQVRIGLNTGKVVAGVLGLHKIAYDLWGDTVNVAARMQTASLPDRIQVSEMTFDKLQGRGYAFSKREKTLIKGKGAMDCYLLEVGTAQEIEAALEASGGVVPVRSESLRWRRRADCDPDGTRQQQGKSDNREGTELGPLASEVEQRNSAVLALPQRTASAMATSHHPATEDTVASAEQLPAEKKETEAAEVSEDKGE